MTASGTRDLVDHLRAGVRGSTDDRLRASWRVLVAAVVLVPLTEAVAVTAVAVLGLAGSRFAVASVGLVQAGTLAVLLLGWARYLDRRSLSEYGLSLSRSWALDLFAGFAAVLLSFVAWNALGTALGWRTVEWAPSAPDGSVLVGLGVVLVAIGLNAWVQDTVVFGVVLRNAAEGLRGRGLASKRAVVGGWVVAVLVFVLLHGTSAPALVVNLLVGGAVFGLLYLHTGELALTVGAHLGSNFVASHVFVPASRAGESLAVFETTGSAPLGPLAETAVLQMAAAYLLAVGWVRLRRGEVPLESGLADWTRR